MKTIIFYASFGKGMTPDKIGGAEVGCIKTEKILMDAGYKVIRLDKPIRNKGIVRYTIKTILAWIKLIYFLINNKMAILHLSGFYRDLISVEWVFIKTAHYLHRKSLYEIRNGGMIEEYEKRGKLYKKMMLSTLKNATAVLCQGEEYRTFISDKLKKISYYYPNYILDSFLEEKQREKHFDMINLIFFGRIVPSKNIIFMIDICEELVKRGFKISLDLIGGCSPEYKQEIENKIKETSLPSSIVKLKGRMNFQDFYPVIKKCHFFLFPSSEEREGHSNSLTEAMGCGLVPIASSAGFNASVVGDASLVMDELNAIEYADKIVGIWLNDEWSTYSAKMVQRIKDNFTESKVKNNLLSVYNEVMK